MLSNDGPCSIMDWYIWHRYIIIKKKMGYTQELQGYYINPLSTRWGWISTPTWKNKFFNSKFFNIFLRNKEKKLNQDINTILYIHVVWCLCILELYCLSYDFNPKVVKITWKGMVLKGLNDIQVDTHQMECTDGFPLKYKWWKTTELFPFTA